MIGSKRLIKINAKVIGIITRTVPANKLPKKFANEGVIIFLKFKNLVSNL